MLGSFTTQTKYQMADGTIFTLSSSASVTRVPGLPDQENTLLPPEEVRKALTDAAALARQQALENALENQVCLFTFPLFPLMVNPSV